MDDSSKTPINGACRSECGGEVHPVMDYERYLTPTALRRRPSPLRELCSLIFKNPWIISLGGGFPNPTMFAYKSAEVQLTDGTTMSLTEEKMAVASQYCQTDGIKELRSWIEDLLRAYHNPPTLGLPHEEGGLNYLATPGIQDGLCKSFEMLLKIGDNALIAVPTYPMVMDVLYPIGCNIISVESDEYGPRSDSLRQALSPWKPEDALKKDSDIPKVFYCVPTGCNPTGMSMTKQRKQEIYKIAREYSLLILEDDPYFSLAFQKMSVPSFLSMDVDGRVIRFDSFSKILAAGIRVGYASGPEPLIRRLSHHLMVSSAHTATLSQMMVSELLEKWGMEGFEKHVNSVREFYRGQKEAICASAKKHLTGLAEWHEPTAGMFLWLKIHGIEDTKKLIEEKALKKEVMFVPGYAFMPDKDKPSPYLRASFSLASPENMDKGLERLAALIKEELQEKK